MAGYEQSLLGDPLAFLERIQDEYPNYQLLAQLAAQAGYGGGGSPNTYVGA